jgi:hypothetical protein
MESLSDLDIADAPEFLDFLTKQNLSEASLDCIEKETKRLFDEYVESTNELVTLCLQNVSRVPTTGSKQAHGNQENLAPFETSSKSKSTKRSIRNSNVKNGKSCSTSNRKLSKAKSYIAKHEVNNDLSQELEEKATVSAIVQKAMSEEAHKDSIEFNRLPLGTVRIEVKSDPKSDSISPHEGEIRFVQPTSNASNLCKIGRSSGKEYSENGVSLNLDLEVSTKHGLLTRSSSKNGIEYFFTDVGSSNGTYFVGTVERLVANEKYKIVNGTQLRMGQSILQFNFTS